MNVYSDDLHTAVDFLSNTAPNISHLLYMGGDFNVKDAEWDPSVSSHPAAGQALMDLAFLSLLITRTSVVMLTQSLTLSF